MIYYITFLVIEVFTHYNDGIGTVFFLFHCIYLSHCYLPSIGSMFRKPDLVQHNQFIIADNT